MRSQHPRQLPCWITQTNEPRTHDIIRAGLDRSPMYTGVIEGVGPRYCPSIEDKIHRFADKDQPPRSSSSRKAWTPTRSTRTASPPACPSTCSWRWCARSAAGERAHPAPRLRHRVRLLRSAQPQGQPGDQVHRRPVLRRPDQRHHRLRGSGGAGPAGRHQRRAQVRASEPAGARAATRPTSACWWTT
jgi:hypothetical protein